MKEESGVSAAQLKSMLGVVLTSLPLCPLTARDRGEGQRDDEAVVSAGARGAGDVDEKSASLVGGGPGLQLVARPAELTTTTMRGVSDGSRAAVARPRHALLTHCHSE